AQPDPIQQSAPGQSVHRRDGVPDRVARLPAGDAESAAGPEVPEQEHAPNVTLSYIFRPAPSEVLPVTGGAPLILRLPPCSPTPPRSATRRPDHCRSAAPSGPA